MVQQRLDVFEKGKRQGTSLMVKNLACTGRPWHTSLIPALRRQRQTDLCEFEASLVHKVSSRTARTIT